MISNHLLENFITLRVANLFGAGSLYCAETVLTVMAEAGGRDAKDVLPLATGFCSGMARTCGQCGAVSGAVMGIGLFAGRTEPGGDYEPAYMLVQEFIEQFSAKYSSVNCLELTECDFNTPEGKERFRDGGVINKCLEMASFAAASALDILTTHGYVPEFKEVIRSFVAPCGLSCGSCAACKESAVHEASQELADALGPNFGTYAERFSGAQKEFANYPAFRELLDFLASGNCSGCRQESCLFQACKVPECVRKHEVDFCFECTQFPCSEHGMPGQLAQRWKANNEAIRDKGITEWYSGCLKGPRYP